MKFGATVYLRAAFQRNLRIDGCPLWVISGHLALQSPCPLYPQKRTCAVQESKSAKRQKRTHFAQHPRTMERLIPSGDEKMMDARSPIIPALTIAGASFLALLHLSLTTTEVLRINIWHFRVFAGR